MSASISATRSARVDELDARYVVGCDGARSLVRRAIGSHHLDLGLHQPWLVVDLSAIRQAPRVKALPDYTVQLCDPARPMTVVHVGARPAALGDHADAGRRSERA